MPAKASTTATASIPPQPTVATAVVMAAKAQLRKFAADAANQLVTALCAAIFMALLYYLGRDFFHNKLADSDQTIKAWLYLVFYHLANAFLAKLLADDFAGGEQRVLPKFLSWLGEPPAKIRQVSAVLTAANVTLVIIAIALIASSPFLPYGPLTCAAIFTSYLGGVLLLSAAFRRLNAAPTAAVAVPKSAQTAVGKLSAMMSWRWRQLVRRNFSTLFYSALALLSLLTASILGAGGLDYRLAGFVFAMAGFFIAAPLYHQLKDDLKDSWFERNNPVSHNQVVACYFGLSAGLLAFWLSLGAVILLVLRNAFAAEQAITLSHGVTWLGLVAIAPITAPGIMFQIDGRVPVIQLTIAFMAVVVLCSLVLIEPLAWLAIPIITYVACSYQQGRFYRS